MRQMRNWLRSPHHRAQEQLFQVCPLHFPAGAAVIIGIRDARSMGPRQANPPVFSESAFGFCATKEVEKGRIRIEPVVNFLVTNLMIIIERGC
jgi:hypothetical protein